MILTEAEAKKKFCPHGRATDQGDVPVSVNRRGRDADPDCKCLASECMAWRWEAYRRPEDRGGDRRGYCGAFGVPMESIV